MNSFGLIFSQRAMLTLIEKGMTREQAYDLRFAAKNSPTLLRQPVDFKPLLEADPEVTSRLTQGGSMKSSTHHTTQTGR